MRNTIKRHTDFLPGDDDIDARSAWFFVRAKKVKQPDDPRYGLVVTKKTFKLAVQRNRAKRLLRDWLRFNEKSLRKDLDYIFIARRNILNATRDEGREAMKKALHYIKKQKREKSAE